MNVVHEFATNQRCGAGGAGVSGSKQAKSR